MSVWEIVNFHINTVAMIGPSIKTQTDPDLSDSFWHLFENEVPGQPLHWETIPELTALAKEGRKKPSPRADVSPFTATGLVLNEKVRAILGDILVQFGQLLAIHVDGKTEFYYNVTNVISCIDMEHSEFDGPYAEVPAFLEQLVPSKPSIFLEPSIHGRIFVNDAAKMELEQRIIANEISGMGFKQWNG